LLVPLIGELLLILMKLQVLELTKPRLSFVAKSGEITRWLNYICAALLLVVLAIFYGKIHLSRKQQVNVHTRTD
jgi:raw score 10.62